MPDPVDNPPRGRPLLAWCVILLVVGFEVVWPYIRRARDGETVKEKAGRAFSDLQARYIVGASHLLGQAQGGAAFYPEVKKTFDTGPVPQRLQFLVLAGELKGPDEARTQLVALRQLMEEQGITPTEDEAAALNVLGRLYDDYGAKKWDAPSLDESDRALLRRELGWTGELALTPNETADPAAREAVLRPARRLAGTVLAVAGAALFLGLFGLVALVVWTAFFVGGGLREALPPPRGHGGVYAEAFALYMVVVFIILGVGRAFLPVRGPELVLVGVAMLVSLAAGLFWPVLRGVPFSEVRREVGLTLGRHPLLEPAVGLGGYLLVLPTFGAGVLISYVLIALQRRWLLGDEPERHFAPIEQPSHPIVEWLGGSNWVLLLQVVVLASVLAPLVEETMFRGVLYRHLREATSRWGRVMSFGVSALVVSFVFAVIHPQGVLAVPALMGLAFGLNILREWRGSLLPSMIVHGLHNGLVTFMLVQGLGGG